MRMAKLSEILGGKNAHRWNMGSVLGLRLKPGPEQGAGRSPSSRRFQGGPHAHRFRAIPKPAMSKPGAVIREVRKKGQPHGCACLLRHRKASN